MASPQTFYNCKVELSADGTTWVDVSLDSNKIDVGGFELETEGTHVFGQNKMYQSVGGTGLGTVTVSAFYQETPSTAAWVLANTAFEGRSALYVRWAPKGGTTGNFKFTSDAGYVKNPVWPSGEYGAAPAMVEIEVETPYITKGTI
jgi:hypothetical protein